MSSDSYFLQIAIDQLSGVMLSCICQYELCAWTEQVTVQLICLAAIRHLKVPNMGDLLVFVPSGKTADTAAANIATGLAELVII